MELPQLGRQCDVESCRQLDFLPIVCKQCGGSFCKEHSLSLYHECVKEEDGKKRREKKEEEEEEEKERGDGKITRHPCQFPKCDGGELTPVLCPGCELNYCLAHRHQYGPSEQEKAAAEKIKQIADSMEGGGGGGGGGGRGGKTAKGKKSEQLAAKVQLMKLKQRAEGDKGIPQGDRIYLLVSLPKSSSSSTPSMPVFVSRTWSVGRGIDAVAAAAKLKNQNNITGAPKLRLFNPSTGELLGSTEQLISELVGTQALFNGQSVVLECVSEGTTHL